MGNIGEMGSVFYCFMGTLGEMGSVFYCFMGTLVRWVVFFIALWEHW